jgi:hypothetical protein
MLYLNENIETFDNDNSYLGPFVLLLPNTFKLLGLPICRCGA